MGLVKGIFKFVGAVFEAGKGTILSDGPTIICPKCGSAYQGFCRNCSNEKSGKLLSEGMNEIKDILRKK